MKLLLILPLLLITILPAIAQEPITLNVDRTTDTIIISGIVYPIIDGAQATIQVSAKGNLVDISQVEIMEDGGYSHFILVDSHVWQKNTNFIIKALYQDSHAKTNFQFATAPPPQLIAAPNITIKNEESVNDLKKEIIELKLYNRVLKQTITSLYIEVDTLNFIIKTLESLCSWVTWDEQI